MDPRVVVTPAASALIHRLRQEHGPLLFHQSGGCCEGSAPMCFKRADFRIGSHDVLLGFIAECPFYIGAGQVEYCANWRFTIDVVQGGGDSFSLEAPEGVRFITRSRLQ